MIPGQFHPPAALTPSIAKIVLVSHDVISVHCIVTPGVAQLDILAIPDV
jgi:hypothetical protein